MHLMRKKALTLQLFPRPRVFAHATPTPGTLPVLRGFVLRRFHLQCGLLREAACPPDVGLGPPAVVCATHPLSVSFRTIAKLGSV